MRNSISHKAMSLLLIAIILCTTTAGLCHGTHAAGDLLNSQSCSQSGSSFVDSGNGQGHCPDADHSGSDHFGSSCFCSCHLPVIGNSADFSYVPVFTDHLLQQSFTPPQEIFLSLFVPPDSLF